MSLLQERCIASPSTGSEVIGWGNSTMKPAFGIFPSLEAAAQSPKTTPTSDGLPQVSPTTSTLKILEQMVAEEEKLLLSTTSGTIVLLPDHQQKPRSLSLNVAEGAAPGSLTSAPSPSPVLPGAERKAQAVLTWYTLLQPAAKFYLATALQLLLAALLTALPATGAVVQTLFLLAWALQLAALEMHELMTDRALWIADPLNGCARRTVLTRPSRARTAPHHAAPKCHA